MKLSGLLPLTVLFIIATATQIAAKPAFTTKYTYYMVGGDSVESIYNAMLSKGPRVNGAKAYASTLATSSQDGNLTQSKTCRIENYKLRIDFVINLPKIRNEKVLPAADRSRWQQFSKFLRKHEETHRAIWLECAANLDSKVRAIKAKSCSDADAQATRLWNATRAACGKRHDAFDRAEQKKLVQHPFVNLVYNRSGRTTHAAKAQ
jgi:predicted secreted Zn-dependent protease